jgi:hypothetical protein
MFPPWHELKQTEMRALAARLDGTLDTNLVDALRKLFDACKDHPDADESICYHGSLTLIYEFDGEPDAALAHRNTEISKIRKLRELARVNPGDRAALTDNDVYDLQERIRILDELITKKVEKR